ncbi:hypothetical protein FE374_17030 [Georgenia yuyongxinii]|uniref:DUF3562 domain-containing protein n=1 Tax=Georgenia yuyongxinii TaxID=2589797 RepID=A0A5B8CD38_9MICO|nr:hypothetical protein [Georgenia yuyongxinii]QDC26086.1 hypothetical protein FE374_17030 [Georgenia yuyongxinii]
MASRADELHQLDMIIERLAGAHAGTPREHIVATVHAAYARFDASPVRDFVPMLVERAVRRQLGSPVAQAS